MKLINYNENQWGMGLNTKHCESLPNEISPLFPIPTRLIVQRCLHLIVPSGQLQGRCGNE